MKKAAIVFGFAGEVVILCLTVLFSFRQKHKFVELH